ncbi:hypothetical protein QBC46DRAFT_435154 [Diplogelasinospora grovesii]|uniref:Uncharacterized protein n=1 Tax=Diplogelasinospora grovesii TaxID=303347 RepID=A0AAN6S530_9PEZI|nr:hypothetical protein QBC46DRAFT_435154 [Diplogelasinospora grovesii]
MHSYNLIATAFSLLTIFGIDSVLAGNLAVLNNCPFPIFCAGARNDGSGSGVNQVNGGAMYVNPYPALNDNVGVVAKCQTTPDLLHPYQLEVAIKDGTSWVDLSTVDGTGCAQLTCAPNDNSCEWCAPGNPTCPDPRKIVCPSQNDVVLHLC